jgi:rhodanese-related sulfurtransferase
MIRTAPFFLMLVIFSAAAAEHIKSISIDELDTLLTQKKLVFIYDANVESTRANVGFIPGARLLESYSQYGVKKYLPAAKSSQLVFYCANTMCTASHAAAERAIGAGYTDVSVMKDGIYGWQKAGKALVRLEHGSQQSGSQVPSKIGPKEAQTLTKKGEAVIVDVREEEERHEIIENSEWIPMSKVSDLRVWDDFKANLPKNKIVIFHCAAGIRAKRAAEKLAGEGMKTMFFEGPDQWKMAGLPVIRRPSAN